MNWFIFYTPWGWAALHADERTVAHSALPTPSPLKLLTLVTQTGAKIRFVSIDDHFHPLVNSFRAYFQGEIIHDWHVNLSLQGLPPFSQQVLQYVYSIPYGETSTYGEVAAAVGSPRAARAVGQVLSRNPIPIIIPCHRILAKNGLGGFTAPQGIEMKKRLLQMEQNRLHKTSLSIV